TGLVVVGEMGGGDFREQAAIVGDTPNAAARLQEVADSDSVVISAATYQLIRGLFRCESLGQRSLKGFANPIQAYRVLHESGAHRRFDVAIQTGLAPMIGEIVRLQFSRNAGNEPRMARVRSCLLAANRGLESRACCRPSRSRSRKSPTPAGSNVTVPPTIRTV